MTVFSYLYRGFGFKLKDKISKDLLPIHLIFDHQIMPRSRQGLHQRFEAWENQQQKIAELTTFGWTVISSSEENDVSNLNVHGLEGSDKEMNDAVYNRFKNQLKYDKDGQYETVLLWK